MVNSRVKQLEHKIDKKFEELKTELVFGDADSEMIEKLKKIIGDSTH